MSKTSVYPRPLGSINNYFNNVVPYININAIRLGIDVDNLTNLNFLFDNTPLPPDNENLSKMGWLQLWSLYANKKGSRTTTVIDELGIRRISLEHQLSSIYDDIPRSKWTQTDRDATGRKGHALGHKAQTTDAEKVGPPYASLDLGGKNQLVLRIKQAGGQKGATKKKGGKPKGIKEYEFHYIVHKPDEAPPANIEQCTQHIIITRTPYRINFEPSQAGKRCSGYVQTIEKPNKAGPVSVLVTAIIPG